MAVVDAARIRIPVTTNADDAAVKTGKLDKRLREL